MLSGALRPLPRCDCNSLRSTLRSFLRNNFADHPLATGRTIQRSARLSGCTEASFILTAAKERTARNQESSTDSKNVQEVRGDRHNSNAADAGTSLSPSLQGPKVSDWMEGKNRVWESRGKEAATLLD
jgi:hypothetical protein